MHHGLHGHGNPYWTHFALLLFLLAWGVIVRRREHVVRRPELGVVALLGWVLAFAYVILDRSVDELEAWQALLRATAVTTGCVYLEIVLSPRREPIPRAILVRSKEVPGGPGEDTHGDTEQRT